MRNALLVLFAALFLLTGCRSLRVGSTVDAGAEDWLMDGGTSQRQQQAGERLAPPLEQAWIYNAGAGFGANSPVIADGFVFVGTRRGEVHGIHLRNGKRLGLQRFGDSVEGMPVLDQHLMLVPNAWGRRVVQAFDLRNGRTTWSARGIPVEAGLLVMGHLVIAADMEGNVRALALSNGETAWELAATEAASYFAAPVQVGQDSVVVVNERGSILALRASTGDVLWRAELDVPVLRTPAVSSHRVFLPTSRGRFFAVDTRNGRVAWTFDVGNATVRFTSPAAAGNQVVFGGTDRSIRSLDAASGAQHWQFEGEGIFGAAPLFAGDVIYAGGMDRNLYAITADGGELLWTTELRGRIRSALAYSNGHLVVLSEPRYVYAFKASSEELAAQR